MAQDFQPYGDVFVNDTGMDIESICSRIPVMIKLTCETFEKAGLLNEFHEFYEKNLYRFINLGFEGVAKEFAKMHPDVFYIPDEAKQ